jgi:hypothetical protein
LGENSPNLVTLEVETTRKVFGGVAQFVACDQIGQDFGISETFCINLVKTIF